ncbi:MAG TPA: autotransporter domain-containing protein, partial [Novosphingobium sp.]
DGEVSVPVSLGRGWLARPHLGTTWVWTDRGAAIEAPAGLFASTVAGDRHRAGFVDGGLAFGAAPAGAARLQPYLDLGLRWQIDGRSSAAASGFGGLPVALEADGARRAAVSALIGAGARYQLMPRFGLFVAGAGQLASGSQSGRVQAGLRAQF